MMKLPELSRSGRKPSHVQSTRLCSSYGINDVSVSFQDLQQARCVKFSFFEGFGSTARKFYVASVRNDVNESLSNLCDGERVRENEKGKYSK